MSEPKLMGVREYARHRGCTHPAVIKAIDAGRLSSSLRTGARGRTLIDQAVADMEWKLTTDPAQQREPEEHRKPAAAPITALRQHTITGETEVVDPPEQNAGEEIASRARIAFSAQRARTAAAKAALAELDLSERRGEMISRSKVTDEAYRQAVKLREAILSVPRIVSHRLVAMKDAAAIQRMLEKELTKALRSLDDGKPGGR